MEHPKLPVLIISMHNKLSVIKKCKELKIEGYILKDDHELIIKVVESLLSGQEYYSEKVKQTLNIQ
jgi:two-component system, NarL family, nitrate/nitrite response regulator NarL